MSVTTAGGLHVKAIWSKAGVGTTVHVQGIGKQANMLFDCGHLDDREFSAKHVFISHGHVDHIGSCVTHARGRALAGKPATYYVPPHCVEPLRDAQRAFEALDESPITMNIVPMQPYDVVEISPTYKVFAFPTQHRVPSQGYAVVHCKKTGLHPQYSHCDKDELIELRKQKVRIHGYEEVVELVYSGDSTLQGLLDLPQQFNNHLTAAQLSGNSAEAGGCHPLLLSVNLDFLFTAELLILEMTYLDGEVGKAAERGHVHLQEFVAHGHLFGNRQIIMMHISAKYGLQEVVDKAGLALRSQPQLADRCVVALSSFGDSEQVRAAWQQEV